MAGPIDPQLQYGTAQHTATQPYPTASALPHNGTPQQPYYLPQTTQHHQAHQPAPSALDPALADPSPSLRDPSTDNDTGDAGEHDGLIAKSPTEQKRPRACDSCRGLKVRCDQEFPDQSCKRCKKAGRPCKTTPPTRKRQKKADGRVAELERKIDALTATLHAQKNGGPPEGRPYGQFEPPYNAQPVQSQGESGAYGHASHEWTGPPIGYAPARAPSRGPDLKRRRLDDSNGNHTSIPENMDAMHRDLAEVPDSNPMDNPWHKKGCRKGPNTDFSFINGLIDRMMTPDAAEKIFNRYIAEICPNFPAVPFPPGTTATEIRDKKPLLFLAVLAGSCHGNSEQIVPQEVQRELTQTLKNQFGDILWNKGGKSIELVQAIQLAVLWYRPPLHYEQHNFYLMANNAAIMALDLGLGRRVAPNVMKLGMGPFQRNHPNSGSIEARRTFLVCYYLCITITMVLRRPMLLRWSKFMEESVQMLETSPEAYPSDRVLCQHVKMAHLGEQIAVQFSMDDPAVDIVISDQPIILALKAFEDELRMLKTNRPVDNDPAIRLGEHVTNLFIHEIALHQNQSAANFQPPFPPETFAKAGKQNVTGPAHKNALLECLTATHGILDTILGVQLNTLLTLPVIFCVRAIYAIVCLMKMWVAVSTPGDINDFIKKEDLKIESYTERLIKLFDSIVHSDAQSPHGKFYYVAKRIQGKFAQIREGTAKGEMNKPCGTQQKDQDQKIAVPSSNRAHQSHSRPTSASQNSLQFLSEVAVGNSSSTPTQQQQQGTLPQTQQPLQQYSQTTDPWYNAGMGASTTSMGNTQASMGISAPNMGIMQPIDMGVFGTSFDQDFDLDLGGNFFNLDMDIFGLGTTFPSFNPDQSYAPDPNFHGYNGGY